MKARVLALLLVLLTGLIQTPVNAGTNTNCIKAQNARSFQSDSSLTLTVDLYWNCTDAPMSGGVIYSVPEDISARCSGPSYASKASSYTSTYAGVVECSIITTNSSRAGSTRSTIKIWSSYDFSTNNVTISHSAIPIKSTPVPQKSNEVLPTPAESIPVEKYYPRPEPSDLQACTMGEGQPYWHCEKAPTWRYVYCVTASKGFLQEFKNRKWRNIEKVSATYLGSGCKQEPYFYSLNYYGTHSRSSGTYKYRFYFPAEKKNQLITASKFSVRILYGGLDTFDD